MVAAGEHIDAVGEELLEYRGGHAESPGRVFTVGDGEVHVAAVNETVEVLGHSPAAWLAHDVADKADPHYVLDSLCPYDQRAKSVALVSLITVTLISPG